MKSENTFLIGSFAVMITYLLLTFYSLSVSNENNCSRIKNPETKDQCYLLKEKGKQK